MDDGRKEVVHAYVIGHKKIDIFSRNCESGAALTCSEFRTPQQSASSQVPMEWTSVEIDVHANDSCGFLVEPSSREAMVMGFAAAMSKLIAEAGCATSLERVDARATNSTLTGKRRLTESRRFIVHCCRLIESVEVALSER